MCGTGRADWACDRNLPGPAEPGCWASGADPLCLFVQVMDKAFMSIVLLLSTFWDAGAPEHRGTAHTVAASGRQGIAVGLLDTLAHVQFCRMRLSAYSVLLQSLLQTAASSAEVGTAATTQAVTPSELLFNPDRIEGKPCVLQPWLRSQDTLVSPAMTGFVMSWWTCPLVSRVLPADMVLCRQQVDCWTACRHMRTCWMSSRQGSQLG